ncbi:Golgi phosphoprotein 3 (GPP34) [Micromonospora matsumotoense]|uniref:Golgi phosphoprotein 3 (GPP34) n=1 Tax=Micromonospora matsumotoense TaxID=121616 RepID=A0A1C5AU86_9ACTN|nr:GPP34 family phosphoprotein [Micromonospora matsumotoense]SCF48777.1 Golgi phosphoprotein 3 (GPP34) [Micromonospora matsumotoense]
MLGNDYFRLAHNDVTGKPRLHPLAVDLGCAAALLAELIGTRRVHVEDSAISVADRRPPEDSLMHVILDQLIAEEGRRHDIRTWLNFLSKQAQTQLAQRLLRNGHVRISPVRRLGRQTGVLYVPVDMNVAAKPWALLSQRLRRHEPLNYDDLALAGLVLATGLESFLLDGATSATSEFLRHQVGRLWPLMRSLLHHTHAAIGDAVLAHRT